ncbi:sugar transferase [Flavobacterium sp. CYK-55]|uniref:sugar transferase n=1 Tax=Flavobacterium sp. CYK-55 TaxID=2835529 RepID=UPI0020C079DF|nr:sugar transferase [Flavobacterium sp. CYK-55]
MKRTFDITFSLLMLIALSWLLLLCYLLASIETRSNGLFVQQRVGQFGKLFWIYKLKTMHPKSQKIGFFSQFFRKYKLDELPQFYNVIKGDMSVVGPRPDVSGYYDCLNENDRRLLELKPGITSEASIKYKNEDLLLSAQSDPKKYNDTVIFPDKVKMNLEYFEHQSFMTDLKIIFKTVFN